MLHPFGRTSQWVIPLTLYQTPNIIFLGWRSFLGVAILACSVPSHCRFHVWLTYNIHLSSPVIRLESHWWLWWDLINSIQASTLCWSWCGHKSCAIQTPYFHVLSNSCRCVSTVIWEHPRRFAKHGVVNLGSSSICSSKRSISTFTMKNKTYRTEPKKVPRFANEFETILRYRTKLLKFRRLPRNLL